MDDLCHSVERDAASPHFWLKTRHAVQLMHGCPLDNAFANDSSGL